MIRVLGGPKRLCDGLTRRELLQVGTLGLLGLGLPEWQALSQAQAAGALPPSSLPGFGRAKACILLFLYGSPSQLETFDPKPDAPVEIRGEFGCIRSSVPGLNVCDQLPRLAQVMDKVTLIRSVSHPYPIHGVAFATTGIPRIDIPLELNPKDPNHWPFIGSVVDYVDGHRPGRTGAPRSPIPRNLVLPWAFSSERVGEVPRSGPYGGFLGQAYDPVCTEFVGRATKRARKTLLEQVWDDVEPYRGITPESRFQLSAVTQLGPELTLDRLDRRRTLLEQIEQLRRAADAAASRSSGIDRHRAMAYDLVGSENLRRAFDLGQEPDETRSLYGMTLFGQAALTARRLVEAGGRFITVFWDEYGLAGTGWDTHWDHFPRMKDELLPGLDQTFSGLLIDLDRRGLLDETLVVLLSEHGRTPKLSLKNNGGRDHWSRCYSVVLAGGGIARGAVVGRSDTIASDPAERRVSPKDILATIYHL
ncbi:MAG TPA: DUF1501 domain-containing protein, partial [Isosphaeraceae bacterium]|nr:DUF1501 domain-containing protein [Isosphaeraceae bacterium]